MAKAETFEDHLSALEKIVEELEAGDLALDKSIDRYQEGVRRLKSCYDLLTKAEKRVKILLRDAEGNLEEKPFAPEGE